MSEIKVKNPSEEELKELGVESWPTWEKEASEFDWHYDQQETCYVVQGRVVVETEGQTVEFAAGDLVIFPAGLDCVWKVKEDIKKHYKMG